MTLLTRVAWVLAGLIVVSVGVLTPAQDAPAGVIVVGWVLAPIGGAMIGWGVRPRREPPDEGGIL